MIQKQRRSRRQAEAHNNLGNVLRELGQLDDAVTSLRKAIEIRPDFAEAHGNLAITLLARGLDGGMGRIRMALANPRHNRGAPRLPAAALTR